MLRYVITPALLVLLVAGLVPARRNLALQQEPVVQQATAEQAFHRGFYLEKAVRDFQKAAEKYSEAIDLATRNKKSKLLVKALLRHGRCLKELGQHAAAQAQFEKALEHDPQNAEARAGIKKTDTSQQELGLRITSLVAQLGGPHRETAYRDLGLLGVTAVPYLEQGLSSRDIGIVSNAAALLSNSGGVHGSEALARGLVNPKVLFPASLVKIQSRTIAGLIVADAALAHDKASIRAQAAIALTQEWSDCTPEVEQRYIQTLRRLLALDDPAPFNVILERGWQIPASAFLALADRITIELRSGDLERQQRALRSVGWTNRKIDMPESYRVAGAEAAASVLARSSVIQERDRASSILREIDAPWTEQTAAYAVAAARAAFANPVPESQTPRRLEIFAREVAHKSVSLDTRLRLMDEACGPKSRLSKKVRLRFTRWVANGAWQGVAEPRRSELMRIGRTALSTENALASWLNAGWQTNDYAEMAAFAGMPHPTVRAMAYHWIGRTGAVPEGISLPRHVVSDLKSDDKDLRVAAWKAAQQFRDPELATGIRAYIKSLEKDKDHVAPLQFLAKIVGRDALPDLQEYLSKKQQTNIIRVMGDLLGVEAAPALVDVAKGHGSGYAVLSALHSEYKDLARDILNRLPDSLMDSGSLTLAAGLLDGAAFKKRVIAALSHQHESMRASGCAWVGVKRMDDAWPILLKLLEDDSPKVRKAAKTAINEIRWFQEVKAGLTVSDRAAAIDKAREMARSASPAQRRGAAFALAALRDQAAIPTLLQLLEDKEAGVQEAAVTALQALGAQKTTKK